MKFDFVLGNPPYQLETENETENGQKRSKSIFHLFQQEADSISNDGTILVYPGGRWIQQSGRGVAQFGKNQLNDTRLKKVIFYSDAKQVFKDADIADGISIVLKNQKKNDNNFDYVYVNHEEKKSYTLSAPGDDILPLNPKYLTIIKKIKKSIIDNEICYLFNSILNQKLFGIESDFVEKNPNAVRLYNGEPLRNNEVKLFTNDKAGKAGRAKWYVTNISNIPKGKEYITKYKVIVSSANAGGQKRDNQLEIVDNTSAFGRSRIALKTFDTLVEAQNFYKYCNSHFIRFAFLLTDEALGTLGKLVPDFMDYSNEQKKINFSCDIDEQLYRIFGITKDEQKMIEETVDNIRKN